jgi:hypothetical protein
MLERMEGEQWHTASRGGMLPVDELPSLCSLSGSPQRSMSRASDGTRAPHTPPALRLTPSRDSPSSLRGVRVCPAHVLGLASLVLARAWVPVSSRGAPDFYAVC